MPNPRHFGPSSGASSSSSVSSRRANLTDEEREKLRAGAKQSSDEYFARGKAAKEAGLKRLRQRRGPFKMASSPPIKYGPGIDERPVAKRSPIKMRTLPRPQPGPIKDDINEEELDPNQRALLRRMRRKAS